ncbi:MAG: NUDIX hydrolase [Myxococcota bacterium]|nr:NUDIX hydrolase [Myxococcota bacterium]
MKDEISLEWEKLARTVGDDFKIFSVYRQDAIHRASGRRGQFTVVDSPDWVNVIPITADEEVIFVRQYRHGTGEISLEIPGGLVDPGESFLDAGLRELTEETGYVSEHASLMSIIEPNPAFMNNRCGLIIAYPVSPTGQQELDTNEVIEVVRYPLNEVSKLIANGVIRHTLVISAFYMLEHMDWRRQK